jgi:hypothetical protein
MEDFTDFMVIKVKGHISVLLMLGKVVTFLLLSSADLALGRQGRKVLVGDACAL